jgi:hypothetical protein
MTIYNADRIVKTKYKIKAVLSGYITTLKNKQKLTLDEGPSLETSSFCLFFNI